MATMTVKDASNSDQIIEKPLPPGRSAAATSRPIALSTEDKTALDAAVTALGGLATLLGGQATSLNQAAEAALLGPANETPPATDTASSGINGRLQKLAQKWTTFFSLLPASLGQKLKTTSLAVSLATDEPLAVAMGAPADTAATSSSGTFSLIALFKRFLGIMESTAAQSFTNLVKGMTAQMTGTTSTAVTGVGASASNFNYITSVVISNAHATVGTEVVLQDGNAGTTFFTFPAAPAYGGATINFNPPLKQPTVNTALYAKNLTTGAATTVSVNGYQAA